MTMMGASWVRGFEVPPLPPSLGGLRACAFYAERTFVGGPLSTHNGYSSQVRLAAKQTFGTRD
jgi:hypothetical protein